MTSSQSSMFSIIHASWQEKITIKCIRAVGFFPQDTSVRFQLMMWTVRQVLELLILYFILIGLLSQRIECILLPSVHQKVYVILEDMIFLRLESKNRLRIVGDLCIFLGCIHLLLSRSLNKLSKLHMWQVLHFDHHNWMD